MPGDESTTVHEQQALAEGVRRQRQELKLLQAELRRDMQNLTEVRGQIQEREQNLLAQTEATREQLRQQQQQQEEAQQQLERREREAADREAERLRETAKQEQWLQWLQQATDNVRLERNPLGDVPTRTVEGAATRRQQQVTNKNDEEVQPWHTERIQRREVKPPTFDGGRDVRRFLEMFNDVEKNNQWAEEQAALNLRLALEDSVAKGVQGLTYEEAKTALQSCYELTINEAWQELRRVKPQKGENIHRYADHIMKMVKRGYPKLGKELQEDMAITMPISSLDDWTLQWIFQLRVPTTYTETIRRFQEYNNGKGRMDHPAVRRMEGQQEDGDVAERFQRLEKQQEMAIRMSKRDNSLDQKMSAMLTSLDELHKKGAERRTRIDGNKETKTCHYYQKVGHLIKDCYK